MPIVDLMSPNPVSRRTVIVKLENGLHLRPQSLIAQTAIRFRSDVRINNGKVTVDAKTMLELMQLAAENGTSLTLEASGDDAEEALEELVGLFESNFEIDESSPAVRDSDQD